jgi:S-(hydroxymethyl)glutathione dehydrogenase/alcohol dehydrogenase
MRGEWSLCANSDALMTASPPRRGHPAVAGRHTVVHRGLAVAAFAETVIIQETGAVKVPEDLPLDLACLIGCAVQTGVGAVLNTAGVQRGRQRAGDGPGRRRPERGAGGPTWPARHADPGERPGGRAP